MTRLTHRRRLGAAVAVAVVTGLVLLLAAADPDRPGRAQELRIRTADGTALDATVHRPVDVQGRTPAVVLAHGFGGDKNDVAELAGRLADEGYVALAYSARGFGASDGVIALDAAVEGEDVSALVDWLAAQPDVALDGPGDPVVGMTGASYGGGISLLAGARDRRLDALVPVVAWHSLVSALVPDAAAVAGPQAGEAGEGGAPGSGAGPGSGPGGVFKSRWAGLLFAAGAAPGPLGAAEALADPETAPAAPDAAARDGGADRPDPAPDPVCGRFADEVCTAYASIARTGEVDAAARARLARATVPDGAVEAPTLLVQAKSDTLFGLGQSVRNAEAVTGPTRLLWIDGGHGAPGSEANRTRVTDATIAWFDRWLRTTSADVTVDGLTWRDDPSGALRTADTFPVATDEQRLALAPAGGGTPPVVNPPGGVPAALTTLPGLGEVGQLLPATDLPGQNAAFDSAPLDADLDVLGAPVARVRLEAGTGRAVLFAKVVDVAPDGSTTLVHSQVAPFDVGALPREVTLALPTLAHRFVAGNRVRVVFAATDQGFANRPEADVYRVTGPDAAAELTLDVPVVPEGVAPLPQSSLVVPLVLLAVAFGVVVVVLVARSRRSTEVAARIRPQTSVDGAGERATRAPPTAGGRSAPPVEITHLAKTYSDGHVAVDDVGFTVAHGQVFGLLGPNGAGKTTLLRMLLGLIGPTAGDVRLFGHVVRPGHPVLARVGALVEGPGFAPYLTGRQNLRAYWEAGAGRGAFDDPAVHARALAVAALGAALDRPVRTYSHGMRQRLAIAQALLGDPRLLVLDEPTDGLDPGQIRGMRDVLAGLADEGRTVLVSSHLLAEVEQVCTHAAVLQRGRLVTAGPVGDLVRASGRYVVTTPDRDRARQVLADLIGGQRVSSQAEGLVIDVNAQGPGDVVAALVHAGVRIDGVAPRQRLEDAFLSLLGEDVPGERP